MTIPIDKLQGTQEEILAAVPKSRQHLVDVAMAMYVNEPCRICGKSIEPSDLDELVFAGYSTGNKSRSAHAECWKQNKPKSEWAYPE